MMHRGLKNATKDIDVVTLSRADIGSLVQTLKGMGYNEIKELPKEYLTIGASAIMRNKNIFQCDIFYLQVCNGLTISDRMIDRASVMGDFGNLHVKLISQEDIFIFKSITEREKDLDDMRILVEGSLDWNVVLDEITKQQGRKIWEAFMVLKIEELKERYGMRVPILRQLLDISEKKMLEDKVVVFLNEKRTMKEIYTWLNERYGYSRKWTTQYIKEMESSGKIAKSRDGRMVVYGSAK